MGKWKNILGVLLLAILVTPSYANASGVFEETIIPLISFLFILIIVFLILREVVCWYWKINESLSVLKEIRDLLKVSQDSSKVNPITNSQIHNNLLNT